MADAKGIEMTRIFDAPREEVWREWTEADRFADWYGGEGFAVVRETMDWEVREGGKWSFVMKGPGRDIHWDGEFVEVKEPERFVFTVTDRPDEEVRDTCTVVLTDLGDGRTEMHFTQGDNLPDEVYRRAEEGWGGFFDRIAKRLAGD